MIQRVKQASVVVKGKVVAQIGNGLLLLVGIRGDENDETLKWVADKCVNLRIFRDDEDKMNRPLREVGGELLVVSQFTLYGDCRKGRRPSFIDAAPPEIAEPILNKFVEVLKESHLKVATGIFGAMMDVELINDGPVTIILEK